MPPPEHRISTEQPCPRCSPVVPPENQGAIPARLTLKKDAPYGPLAGEVRLQFAAPEDYTLTVPFAAYVAEGKDS